LGESYVSRALILAHLGWVSRGVPQLEKESHMFFIRIIDAKIIKFLTTTTIQGSECYDAART
jgi:hypothetical protein